MSAPSWATVPKSDLGRALQALGSSARHWLKLLRAVKTVAGGAVVAFFSGSALLQLDKALPGFVRSLTPRRGSAAFAASLLPTDITAIRRLALCLLLLGLGAAAWGFIGLCHWFLDRRNS